MLQKLWLSLCVLVSAYFLIAGIAQGGIGSITENPAKALGFLLVFVVGPMVVYKLGVLWVAWIRRPLAKGSKTP